jgi:fatty-acyl-CoA synthase
MTQWNYADVWEAIAATQPDEPAVVQGDRITTWGEFEARARGVASWLLSLDVAPQDKVALYLYNAPEYLEGIFAALRIGLVPVNTNYRYGDDELLYLWDNADAVAVIFHGAFTERIEGVRDRATKVRGWLWVDDGSGPCPSWAMPFDEVATSGPAEVAAPWGRGPDDLIMLYTGGTTGMPKGVMWRQDDLFARLNPAGLRRYDPDLGIEGIVADLRAKGPGQTLLPACPLMHGTGLFTALEYLAEGGQVVLLESRRYSPHELARTIDEKSVNVAVIVGDPFARPLLDAIAEDKDRYSLSTLVIIMSSGAMWSEENKAALLEHHPGMFLIDAFSSSEALGMGSSISAAGSEAHTGSFTLGPEVRVLTTDGRDVAPGSDEIGVLALGGRNPLGYYKDEAKSAATFKVIDGVRYSVPGDFAKVHADGTIQLLGRGSQCINTAGEKVYPEEVEEALKRHGAVADACVVGIADDRTGERVVAAVELVLGAEPPHVDDLIAHVKGSLASYKAPRQIRIVETIGRTPAGKMDYGRHKQEMLAWLDSHG